LCLALIDGSKLNLFNSALHRQDFLFLHADVAIDIGDLFVGDDLDFLLVAVEIVLADEAVLFSLFQAF
jgi:hypothetical protein